MSTTIWILLIIVALFGGLVGGIFIARKQIEKEIGEHPRLTPDAIREMMSQMGQKPSEAKVQQTYRNIVKHAKTAIKTKNKSVLALKRLVMK
ncbi:TPA: YneF family protein [Streptococcus agalactiae]